jgi:hypothetical protein
LWDILISMSSLYWPDFKNVGFGLYIVKWRTYSKFMCMKKVVLLNEILYCYISPHGNGCLACTFLMSLQVHEINSYLYESQVSFLYMNKITATANDSSSPWLMKAGMGWHVKRWDEIAATAYAKYIHAFVLLAVEHPLGQNWLYSFSQAEAYRLSNFRNNLLMRPPLWSSGQSSWLQI